MSHARVLALILVAVLTAALAIPAFAQEDGDTADVTVIHGIPEATVDVYLNGDPALEDFEPSTVTDPIELPAGTYDVEVYAADADPSEADPVVAAEGVAVPADINASIVAHLTEEGDPTLSVFVNDISPADDGNGRVTVRHTAAAPAVDVFVDGTAAITDLANPDEASADLPAATYEVAVAVADAPVEEAVIGPLDLELPADTLVAVYAVFAAADGSITALTQAVPLETDDDGEAVRDSSRLEGHTRIGTSVAISQRQFPAGSDVVYLARQDIAVDAVAGGILTDGPILLVPTCGELPQEVADEIARLDPAEVIALGGTAAICDDILEAAAQA